MNVGMNKEELVKRGNRAFSMLQHCVEQHINRLERQDPTKIVVINFDCYSHILQLVGWRPTNYTAIFTREFLSCPSFCYPKLPDQLLLWCYHDSCWRGEGVQRALNCYEGRIKSFLHYDMDESLTIAPETIQSMKDFLRKTTSLEENKKRCQEIERILRINS